MTKISDNINSYQNLAAYNADMEKEYPNVSYLIDEDEVKWNRYDPDHIVCVYNVTSTESATTLLYSNNYITYQIIDGVRQDTIQTTYTFDTLGEHIVKYKLNGTSIDYMAFYNCTGLTSITIPNSVTSIGRLTFRNCTGLTSITIPDSVTSIDEDTFRNCSSLTNITIPSNVTSIGTYAFSWCSSLTSVTIPSNVTSIGTGAFYSCTCFTSVTVEPTTPPTMDANVFIDTNNCPIYVPAESVEAYKTATNWSTYASRIQAIPSE